MKKTLMSDCKDPENRSKKKCVCGNHSIKAKRSKNKNRNTFKLGRKPYRDVGTIHSTIEDIL